MCMRVYAWKTNLTHVLRKMKASSTNWLVWIISLKPCLANISSIICQCRNRDTLRLNFFSFLLLLLLTVCAPWKSWIQKPQCALNFESYFTCTSSFEHGISIFMKILISELVSNPHKYWLLQQDIFDWTLLCHWLGLSPGSSFSLFRNNNTLHANSAFIS